MDRGDKEKREEGEGDSTGRPGLAVAGGVLLRRVRAAGVEEVSTERRRPPAERKLCHAHRKVSGQAECPARQKVRRGKGGSGSGQAVEHLLVQLGNAGEVVT